MKNKDLINKWKNFNENFWRDDQEYILYDWINSMINNWDDEEILKNSMILSNNQLKIKNFIFDHKEMKILFDNEENWIDPMDPDILKLFYKIFWDINIHNLRLKLIK